MIGLFFLFSTKMYWKFSCFTMKTFAVGTVLPNKHSFKSVAGCYRPVSYADGPITAGYRLVKNASWVEGPHQGTSDEYS